MGTAELRQGNLDGLEKLDRSREIAQQTGDEIGLARAYMHPTAALAGRREWVLAERYLWPGREFCRERGLHGFYGWLTTFAAESALAQGRWAEAVSAAAEILAWPAEGFGQFRVTALVVTAAVRARRGEPGYQAPLDEAAVLAQSEPRTARARRADRRAAGGGRVAGGGGAAAGRGRRLARGGRTGCHALVRG